MPNYTYPRWFSTLFDHGGWIATAALFVISWVFKSIRRVVWGWLVRWFWDVVAPANRTRQRLHLCIDRATIYRRDGEFWLQVDIHAVNPALLALTIQTRRSDAEGHSLIVCVQPPRPADERREYVARFSEGKVEIVDGPEVSIPALGEPLELFLRVPLPADLGAGLFSADRASTHAIQVYVEWTFDMKTAAWGLSNTKLDHPLWCRGVGTEEKR